MTWIGAQISVSKNGEDNDIALIGNGMLYCSGCSAESRLIVEITVLVREAIVNSDLPIFKP